MSFLWYIVLPALSFFLLRRYLLHIASKQYQLSSKSNGQSLERTREEIYHAAFLLRQKLPAELVPAILDYAEFWVKTTSIMERDLNVRESDLIKRDDGIGGTIEEGVPYLFTDCIGMEGLSGLHPVRKVVFTLVSKDQGYSWDQEWHETYEHSWTWFEAVVANFEDEDDVSSGRGKRIMCNLHAGKEFLTHAVEWDISSDDEEKKYVFSEGGESEWIKGLVRGQKIGITAWARFDGWTNYIQSAKIEVFTAAVR
jgi:hypothetical protein